MNTRYQRQIILPEIGSDGQKKLRNARVLCVGAGGLGCPAALYLAAAGIGHITLIDSDCVEESNLQRQILFTMDDIGRPKAFAARDRLMHFNPDVTVTALHQALNAQNAESLLAAHDVVVDGTDNFPSKFLINDAAVKTRSPVIYGAIQGFDGQVGVFDMRHPAHACYRCLYPSPPATPIRNCAENGVIGAVAGVIGTLQAMEAIKMIIGGDAFSPLVSRLLTLDFASASPRVLHIPKRSACPVCSCSAATIKLEDIPFLCARIEEITPTSLSTIPNAMLLDVREEAEWADGFIPSALHHPLSSILQGSIPNLDKNALLVVYCQHGRRSQRAIQIMAAHGYAQLMNLAGGYAAWVDDGLRTSPRTST